MFKPRRSESKKALSDHAVVRATQLGTVVESYRLPSRPAHMTPPIMCGNQIVATGHPLGWGMQLAISVTAEP